MKIYTHKPSFTERRLGEKRPPLAPGNTWAQFGDETLIFEDAPAPSMPGARASRGARMARRNENVSREEMYVVVQNGRLFEQHNPDVPILHNRGRFLLVKLESQQAKRLSKKHETCYGLVRLQENQVVFDERQPRSSRSTKPAIQSVVNQINRANFDSTLTKLTSFTTRHSTSSEFIQAATWARTQLKDMGFATSSQIVAVGTGKSRNIIADKVGLGSVNRGVVLVCAHLDSINLAGGPAANAPGADDNGSGSAGVLEIARVLSAHKGNNDLRLILFGGEEQGLFGSKHYVAKISSAERKRIRAVVNMDMIGVTNSPDRTVLIEGSPISQSVIDGLSEAAANYTQLKVETSLQPFASDHVPFIDAQVPAVLTIEGADDTNDNIHSANDTRDKIDSEIALEILRMNTAFVLEQLG